MVADWRQSGPLSEDLCGNQWSVVLHLDGLELHLAGKILRGMLES